VTDLSAPPALRGGVWARQVEQIEHNLVDHASLTTETLATLSATLPATAIEQHIADLPLLHPSGAVQRIAGATAELLRVGCSRPWWVMIGGLEKIDPYRTVADAVAHQWMATCSAGEGSFRGSRVTAFVSSAGSVVPGHFDHDHNLLLQVRGEKDVIVADEIDEPIVDECIASRTRNVSVLPGRVRTFHLEPGVGLYLPPFATHWVVGSCGPSVSLSSAWSTAWSERDRLVRAWNARLRRLGLDPRPPWPPGRGANAKAEAVRAVAWIRAALGSLRS
jgi:hypothetical protein